MSTQVPDQVLDQYAIDWRSGRVESLGGAGGFSGAQFWRLGDPGQQLCLRRWPKSYPDRKKLIQIHNLLQRVFDEGLSYLPVPLKSRSGSTIVEAAGQLWELSPWMPGRADYCDHPSRLRLAASLRCLAEFHHAAATTGGAEVAVEVSPGILHRHRRLQQLSHGGANRIAVAAATDRQSRLGETAAQLLARFWQCVRHVAPTIEEAASARVPLQSCIRDVWHDHVLLTGDVVTGLIDFGAVNIDTVAGDIARLLGSMVGDEPEGWQVGLRAYESIRSLNCKERALIGAFDRANVTLSGMQWLEWIYVEGRRFEASDRIVHRLEQITARIDAMLAIK